MGRVGKGKKIEKIRARRKIKKIITYSCTGEKNSYTNVWIEKKFMRDENSPHPPSLF